MAYFEYVLQIIEMVVKAALEFFERIQRMGERKMA